MHSHLVNLGSYLDKQMEQQVQMSVAVLHHYHSRLLVMQVSLLRWYVPSLLVWTRLIIDVAWKQG
jgi:hypothetical protein